jgi:hypothetical protein
MFSLGQAYCIACNWSICNLFHLFGSRRRVYNSETNLKRKKREKKSKKKKDKKLIAKKKKKKKNQTVH